LISAIGRWLIDLGLVSWQTHPAGSARIPSKRRQGYGSQGGMKAAKNMTTAERRARAKKA